MNQKKKSAFGVTFTGNVTFQGPMFDIHDNEHVHLHTVKEPLLEESDETMEMEPDITEPAEELNYFQPKLHLKKMLMMEWFELCRIKKTYTTKWRENLIDALMESQWKDVIAKDWSYKDRRCEVKGYIIGILKDGGVLKGSYDSIALIAGITHKTRTFSKYMGKGKKQPYYGWVISYIKQSMEEG